VAAGFGLLFLHAQPLELGKISFTDVSFLKPREDMSSPEILNKARSWLASGEEYFQLMTSNWKKLEDDRKLLEEKKKQLDDQSKQLEGEKDLWRLMKKRQEEEKNRLEEVKKNLKDEETKKRNNIGHS
jgi:isopropylmalate/homocitrate/citramalate synthase